MIIYTKQTNIQNNAIRRKKSKNNKKNIQYTKTDYRLP